MLLTYFFKDKIEKFSDDFKKQEINLQLLILKKITTVFMKKKNLFLRSFKKKVCFKLLETLLSLKNFVTKIDLSISMNC